MITTTGAAEGVILSGQFQLSCQLSISLDGEIIATDVPVASGREEFDADLRVPERVVLTVPRISEGVDWAPTSPTSPLNTYGQRAHIRLGVGVGTDGIEWMDRGEFLIQDVQVDNDVISVTAVGLLALIDEARLVSPYRPTGTLISTLRGLVEPALTVVVSDALTNRSVPSGINYDEDRLAAVLELLDAWPAVGQVTEDGYLYVSDQATLEVGPTIYAYNRRFQTSPVGTVERASSSGTREGIVNAVVARGNAADGSPVQGVVYDRSGGPSSYGGAFNPLPVPDFFYSPLLTTQAQCERAALTILRRKTAPAARRFSLTCVPDPRIQGRDQIGYVPTLTGTREDATTMVEKLSMPYTPDSGAMTLTLREVTA